MSTKVPPVKLNLRMPPDLRAQAEAQAEAMGVSLNAYCLLALRNFIPYTARQTGVVAAVRAPRSAASPPSPHTASTRHTTAASRATGPKVGRNEPCPCGSGRKAKHCHPDAC